MSTHALRVRAHVVVVGLLDRQVRQVETRVGTHGVAVISLPLAKLLRIGHVAADLVIVARFCQHKHSQRIVHLTDAPVRFVHAGGVSSVVAAIFESLNLTKAA